jgi:hypothetical protein
MHQLTVWMDHNETKIFYAKGTILDEETVRSANRPKRLSIPGKDLHTEK